MKKNEFFTTGVFAKMCNVTKQTLFHYDEIGLLTPHHKDNNGYRFYSYRQFEIMYVIETLKEIEMSLTEIKDFINVTTPDLMIKVFKEKSIKISEKIDKLTRIQKAIEKKIIVTESAKELDLTKINLEEVNEEYLFLSESLLNNANKEKTITDFYDICMNELNEKYLIGGMIKKEQLLQGHFSNFEYLYTKTDETTKLPLYKKEKCKQVIGYHIGNYESLRQSYSKLLHYIQNNRLEIISFSYEEYILDAISVNDSDNYVTRITIPVKECE